MIFKVLKSFFLWIWIDLQWFSSLWTLTCDAFFKKYHQNHSRSWFYMAKSWFDMGQVKNWPHRSLIKIRGFRIILEIFERIFLLERRILNRAMRWLFFLSISGGHLRQGALKHVLIKFFSTFFFANFVSARSRLYRRIFEFCFRFRSQEAEI